MKLADRSMGWALAGLRRLAGTDVLDRLGMRETVQDAVRRVTRDGFRAAATTSRAFGKVAISRDRPARQQPREARLFDLTPTEEQQMLREAFGRFASDRLRPAARKADESGETPVEILEQAAALGSLVLAVPPELGGVVGERASVTTVLAAEELAHGDLGLAVSCLAPGAVAAAISLWGDADQQGRYLPSFTAEDPPAAALAIQEPRALFDPFAPSTHAHRTGEDLELHGVKSLVPRVTATELFVVATDIEGSGPGLLLVESGDAMSVEPDPAMGVRAAATGRVHFDGVRVPQSAVLGDGSPDVYAEAVHRARLAWCALSVGTAQAVLDYVIPYVNEREAFGEPISHRQSVAFAVSDIAIELEGMRLATYRAASLADQGRPFAQATTAARRLCATKGMNIGSTGVQLLGGHGYVKEHPVERWYRDLRAAGVLEGILLA